MIRFVLCFLILMVTNGISRADDITFEASVNSARVALDEVLQLTLTIKGVNENLDPVSLPTLDGFSAKYLGPLTSVTIVNGSYHSERSFRYDLFPNKVGKFQIPPISATIDGHNYTTKPIDIEVVQNLSQTQNSSQPTDQAPSTESLKDKIFLIATTDKTDVYLNEQVPLTIKFLYNMSVRDLQMPQFDKTGFEADDYDKPQEGTLLINGINYNGVQFKTNIYPNATGDITLGPVQIQCNVLYKSTPQNSNNQDNGFFGADLMNAFFDTYAARPDTVMSQPIHLHVLPLPEENRPQDFNGAIGQFDFKVSVSPAQVKVGDPLTLKMELKGSGNFKNLKFPVFNAPGFKTYPPQIKNNGDDKTAEQVVIPTSAALKEIPAMDFSYFDTSLKDYKTITQGPFPIQVSSPSPDQEFKAVGFVDISKTTSPQPVNQFNFGKLITSAFDFVKKLSHSIWFWLSLGFLFASGVSYYLWRRFQEKLLNDPAFARRHKAVREARKTLLGAGEYILKSNSKDFYALLTKVLFDYFANKWHQPSAALSLDKIISRLKTSKTEDSLIEQIKSILEQCDLVCFAGATFDSDKMRKDLLLVQDLITNFEKKLK